MESLEDITVGEFLELIEKRDLSKVLELLLNNKKKWNQMVEETKKLKKRIFIEKADLKGKDLSGVNFSNTTIDNSDLSEANLEKVNFSQTIITNSNLAESVIDSSLLYETRISQTNMSNVSMYDVTFSKVYLTGSVNLIGTYIGAKAEYTTSAKTTEDGFGRAGAAYSGRMSSTGYY